MQSEPHWVKPASQVPVHLPPVQLALPLGGAGQAFPQAPQCWTSCWGSTQAAPHWVSSLQVVPQPPL